MYTAFAIMQIGMAVACLFFVSSFAAKPIWTSIALILAGLVSIGNGLRVAHDVFAADSAFYLYTVLFPYVSNAMIGLMFVTGAVFASRLLRGGRL